MYNKTRGFTFNFTPLTISHGITVINGVPDKQNYNSITHEYVPDYSVVPIKLRPWVNIVDKDNILTSGDVKSQLATITWTVTIGSKVTTITANSTDGYLIKTEGSERGDLIISKNIDPDTTATFKFKATYYDSRTKQTHTIEDSYLLTCASAAGAMPVLSLNFNDSFVFNPLSCAEQYTIAPTLHVDGSKVDSSTFALAWQIKDATGGHWRDITVYDTGVEIVDKTLVLTTAYFPGSSTFRVRAVYDKDGNPDISELDEASPEKIFAITRRIPSYEAIIVAPNNLSPDTESIFAECYLQGSEGTIENPEGILLPKWYADTDTSDGNPNLVTEIGYGFTIDISTSIMSLNYGMMVGVEILDVQPVNPLVDNNGNYIVDENNNIMMI
jgi:hypothetical protein